MGPYTVKSQLEGDATTDTMVDGSFKDASNRQWEHFGGLGGTPLRLALAPPGLKSKRNFPRFPYAFPP